MKRLLAGCGICVALLAPAPALQAQSAAPPLAALPAPVAGYETTLLGPDYYSFRYLGARSIFLITTAGVIATDPQDPAAARQMREEIRKLTLLPVKYVVYSHQHWDHVRGGKIFKDEGARFISHVNCIAHFKDMPNADIIMPDIAVKTNKYDLKLGNHTLQLRYLGPNHGDCLLIMTPAHVNIPFIVDLASAGGMPLSYMPDYSLHNWVRSLRELEGWSFAQFTGGHGVPLADKSRLSERREYLEALMSETKRELDASTAISAIPDIVAERLRERFQSLRSFNENVRDNVRRTITYYGMGW